MAHDCEHIIVLGQRGLSDTAIRAQLVSEDDLVFVTQDSEFEVLPAGTRAAVVISRIPQRLPIAERVERWARALDGFLSQRPSGHLFEILPDGQLVALEERR
ncbi:MAG: hypothetical protein AB1679_17095 [Actinomycetota bacterium]